MLSIRCDEAKLALFENLLQLATFAELAVQEGENDIVRMIRPARSVGRYRWKDIVARLASSRR